MGVNGANSNVSYGRTLSGGSSSGSSYSNYSAPNPNPDPKNFRFVQFEEVESNLVVMIEYPNCTNYEGKKILLFKEMTLNDLFKKKEIDPHFVETDTSLMARFQPTNEGWAFAIQCAENL